VTRFAVGAARGVVLLAFAAAAVAAPTSAPAGLIPLDSGFGPHTIIRDTSSGLDWLNLSVSRNRSTAEIADDLLPGHRFDGFRYADFFSELCPLVQAVFSKDTCSGVFGFRRLDPPTIRNFINLFGPTVGSGDSAGLRGVLGPISPQPGIMFSALFFGFTAEADSQAVNFPRRAFPFEGSFLVRPSEIPEPGSLGLMVAGLAWLGVRWCRPRAPHHVARRLAFAQ
jgi:hypothetical protein